MEYRKNALQEYLEKQYDTKLSDVLPSGSTVGEVIELLKGHGYSEQTVYFTLIANGEEGRLPKDVALKFLSDVPSMFKERDEDEDDDEYESEEGN